MKEAFCSNCGHEKMGKGKFCANCGSKFLMNDVMRAAVTFEETVNEGLRNPINSISDYQNKNSAIKTWPNVLVSIIISIALIMLNAALERQTQWGGLEDYISQTLIFIILFQVLSIFLQRRKKSLSVLFPAIIGFISIFPTLAMYKDYQDWLYYQGYNTQAMASGDLTIMGKCFVLFGAVAIVNVVSLFISSKKHVANPIATIEPLRNGTVQEKKQHIGKNPSTSINLFLNIVIGILLYNWGSAVQEYLEWGYGDTQVAFFFVFIAILQIIVVFFERANKSFYGAIPIVFAVISCFPTFIHYVELQSLIDSEGYSHLLIPVSDRVFMTVYFVLNTALIVTNFFLINKRWSIVQAIKKDIGLSKL
ncbi:zinc ribbon domain-containing protein [Planococcus shenhongbingii]|uniref:Zinc ribbon domain-containing protein n=1 Tax=Planococcus shenhongbingii TaxID=3058398 RepID=A0ABT8NA57_9BACL|nr:zinc ribbon domain-containing protein [Planococcus sp. N017]MDN7244643.1 zinc ribbon domain-containing protein [Planococcus sp. N017]